ncbi:hypothetical protein [Tautonia rosea]|uniref:hypothetical protein n=1 Tax=Tautonia rosea TaxID=2728037 RepID=UPI0014732F8C|nr:hypothetical protein [Tautonia rosea]
MSKTGQCSQAIRLDPFDPQRLRLPDERIGRAGPPRHAEGEPFLRGPIPYGWVACAAMLPGPGFSLAMLCRFLRDRFPARPKRFTMAEYAAGVGASVWTVRRSFREAERAGLILVDQKSGRKPTVAIIDPTEAETDSGRPPLYGPVPWSWWYRTLRLPGKAPQVAGVCWTLAGWERSGSVELVLGDWSEWGLSRYAASRGLDALERAELVEVRKKIGCASQITLLGESGGR